MSAKSRSVELDVIRTLMNYLIVLLHAWAAFQYVKVGTIEFKTWTLVCSHLCWMAIPTFFLISGYLLFLRFSIATWPAKLWRRTRRLVVPYAAWNVLFVVFYLSLARFVPRLGVRVASFGMDTFAGTFSKVFSFTVPPIDGPLWFLRTLFFLTVLSPIFLLLLRIGRGVPVVILSLAWCVLESVLGLRDKLHLVAPAYSVACFLFGGALAMNGKDIVDSFRKKRAVWLCAGLSACALMSLKVLPAVESLLAVLEAPALIALSLWLNGAKIVQLQTYRFLHEMSFFAYAGHFLFCSIWLHTLAPFLGGFWTGKFTVLILIFVGCGVPTMAVVYLVAKRFCPQALKLFDGSF